MLSSSEKSQLEECINDGIEIEIEAPVVGIGGWGCGCGCTWVRCWCAGAAPRGCGCGHDVALGGAAVVLLLDLGGAAEQGLGAWTGGDGGSC
ncbi:hypothetical protein V6N13_099730 [Hibiscus sabdariffa]